MSEWMLQNPWIETAAFAVQIVGLLVGLAAFLWGLEIHAKWQDLINSKRKP